MIIVATFQSSWNRDKRTAMSTKTPMTQKEEIFQLAKAAMRRAAINAREKAIETGTAIVIVRDGKLVHISAAELQQQKAAGEWHNIRVIDRSKSASQ